MPATIHELSAPSLNEIRDAQQRLKGVAVRTPLVQLDTAESAAAVWLKL